MPAANGRFGRQWRRQKAQATRSLFEASNIRAGAPISAAAIFVGARARTLGQPNTFDADTGEDLVPESSVQDETGPNGERRLRSTASKWRYYVVAATSCRSGIGKGWQTVFEQFKASRWWIIVGRSSYALATESISSIAHCVTSSTGGQGLVVNQ